MAIPKTNIEPLCASKGMRMTEQRRVIARVLADSVDHPDVEELYRRCAEVDKNISISTVYRTVKLFEDSGIIERHDFREGRARYEQIPDTHHDHLINLRTGQVIEFQSEEIEKLQAEIARLSRLVAALACALGLAACGGGDGDLYLQGSVTGVNKDGKLVEVLREEYNRLDGPKEDRDH